MFKNAHLDELPTKFFHSGDHQGAHTARLTHICINLERMLLLPFLSIYVNSGVSLIMKFMALHTSLFGN